MKHVPVMLEESLEFFKSKKMKTFFDGTLGAGGFAKALLLDHPEIETYFGCDRDKKALEIAREKLEYLGKKVIFIHGNFRDLDAFLKNKGVDQVDGFFFDFGVSSMQLDEENRGFSFNRKGPLDMRMDQKQKLSASDVVNHYSEKELRKIFKEFGEEPQSKRAASAIVKARKKKYIETTKELSDIITASIHKIRKKLHPATLIFQALRIFVNRELESITEGVKKAIQKLSYGGRIGALSFHRLEDRIVKNIFREASRPLKKIEGIQEIVTLPSLKLLTKSPLTPSRKEGFRNRRSTSAKLRFAEKL